MVALKKTYRKVILREVRHSISRFLAIFAIVALGVGFLAGLLATTPDMRLSTDRYYDETNLMDIRVLSTLGLSDGDIEAIRSTEGVAGVMPGYSADVLVDGAESSGVVARFVSLPLDKLEAGEEETGYQNRIVLTEGRYPQEPGEVAVLSSQYGGVSVGTTFTLSADNEDLSETLAADTFTVVGIADSSYYMSVEQESSTVGNGTVSLTFFTGENSFAYSAYTEAYVLVEGAKELDTFSDQYEEAVSRVEDALEEVGQTQAVVRYDEIVGEAQDELDKGRAEYEEQKADAEQQLADARQELDDAKQQLEDGEKQLEDSRQELENSRQELADGRQELEDGEKQLEEQKAAFAQQTEETQAQLDAAKQQLEDGRTQLEAAKAELDAAKEQIDQAEALMEQLLALGQTEQAAAIAARLEEQKPVYEAGLAEYEKNAAALAQQQAQLEAGQQQLDAGRQQAEAEFAAAQQKLDESRKTIEEGESALADGEKEIADAEQELADARKELADGEAEYASSKQEAEEELAKAEQELADAQQQIDDIEVPEWYVLDRQTNVSFVSFDSNADKVAAIAQVFPVFFFLVAALVALTTMTRMVEEERTQIGTLKALGYTNGAIAFKFLLYAGAASLLGSVFGLLVGFQIFPIVIWNAYRMLYTLPPLVTMFHIPYALAASLAAILCTVLATLGACVSSLRERPARLMLPKAPKAGRRVFLEHIPFIWKHLKFTHKVTARNLLRYKKRFFMTIVGVAGCTALLVAGFGVRDSIGDIVGKQFGELYQYNLTVGIREEDAVETDEALRAVLEDESMVTEYMGMHSESGTLTAGRNTTEATVSVPRDTGRLADFNILRDRRSGDAVAFGEDTALLTEKQAETLGISVGDTFRVENADGKTATLTLGGIIENYFQGTLYLSASLYEEAFGQAPAYTTLLVKVPDPTQEHRDAVTAALLACDSVQSTSFTNDLESSFSDMLGSIDYIVIVLIVSAAALAFVVLYNLTNINITERQKELATIKVLGFYDREVAAYIFRETAILTVLGALAGLVLGIFLHAFVVRTAEVDMVMFGREIKWLSYVLSFVMTLIFSFLVDIVMNRKLKKIDMVESMKAGE